MSPSGPQTSPTRSTTLNGIPVPPTRGHYDMDGETTGNAATVLVRDDLNVDQFTPGPADATQVLTETELPSSSGATLSSASARGFLMGPQGRTQGNSAPAIQEGATRPAGGFLGGVAKAVQAIPAAVEGFVMGHGVSGPSVPESRSGDTGGFISAQSGSPDRPGPLLGAAPGPAAPLLDEHTLQRLN